MYVEGVIRSENYDRVSNRIIQALDDEPVVAYVTYGNPLAHDSVAQQLVNHARQAAVPFKVVAGISSIDTLLCDLGVDMAPGIQVYEASWFVGGEVRADEMLGASMYVPTLRPIQLNPEIVARMKRT